MPMIQIDTPPQETPMGLLLQTALSGATGYMQGKSDKAYRQSAAKLLGIDPDSLAHFDRADIKDLLKEKKFGDQEWKPKTKAEALELAGAKRGASKTFEEDLKTKAASGMPLDENEKNYYNKFLRKSMDEEYTNPGEVNNLISGKKPDTGTGVISGIGNVLKGLIGNPIM
jgi:hypothetical protein